MCHNNEVNKQLFEAVLKLKKQSHVNFKLKDIYAGEFMALRTIHKLKQKNDENSIGVKTSDIGNCLFMKKPATSKMLNNLEDKGYINRLSDKKDRRVTYIDLTERGEELLEKHHRQMVDYTNRVIHEMGEEDMKTFIKLLNKLSDIMDDLKDS